MATHKLDKRIEKLQLALQLALEKRSADIIAEHTFTAADYRIRIVPDPISYTIEQIMGELAGPTDSQSVHDYQARLQAVFDNDGYGQGREELHAYGLIVEQRDPETGEFDVFDELDDSVWGLFHLTGDSWEEFEKHIIEEARDCLPDDIDANKVEVVVE